jgi:H+/Cl- antiporter ClcA
MQIIKTIIFFIVLIYFIVHINKYFFNIYGIVQNKSKDILTNYSKYFHIYIIILFFIASTARYFYHSSGLFDLYINNSLQSLNHHTKFFNDNSFFAGGLSIIAIYIFSLLAVASEAGVADEGMIIYTSISILLFAYFKFKSIFNLKDVYTEIIIYLGIAVGFTIIYSSIISTFVYIIETMLINKDQHFFSNFGVMVCAIPFIDFLVGDKHSFMQLEKLYFDSKQYGFIALFSFILGIISLLFYKSILSLYNFIKKSKYSNLFILGFGLILSFIIKKLGFLTFGIGEEAITNAFESVKEKEKLKKEKQDLQAKENQMKSKQGSEQTHETNQEQSQEKKINKQIEKDTKNIEKITVFNEYTVLGRIVNCIISVGCGLTGGILVPTMTIGCGLGSLFSKYTSIPEKNLMYLGISGFLSPFLRAPITSALVINRISNQPYNTLPLSIAVSFISYFTYNFINKKFN